jgi:hypothetical protein
MDVPALRALRLVDARTGGYHHRQRMCQPSGLNPNSRIFCKIHYRAGSLREIHYARF